MTLDQSYFCTTFYQQRGAAQLTTFTIILWRSSGFQISRSKMRSAPDFWATACVAVQLRMWPAFVLKLENSLMYVSYSLKFTDGPESCRLSRLKESVVLFLRFSPQKNSLRCFISRSFLSGFWIANLGSGCYLSSPKSLSILILEASSGLLHLYANMQVNIPYRWDSHQWRKKDKTVKNFIF